MTTLAEKLRVITTTALANKTDKYSIARAEFMEDLVNLKNRLIKETEGAAQQGLAAYYLSWKAAGLKDLMEVQEGTDFAHNQVVQLLQGEGFVKHRVLVYRLRTGMLDPSVDITVEW